MTSKKKGKKRSRPSRSKKVRKKVKRSLTVDTLGSWLSAQEKKRRPPAMKKKESAKTLPNTMEDWLRVQKPVVEVERVEITIPPDSTELWIRNQIVVRQSSQKDRVEDNVEVALEETNLGESSAVPHSSEE